MMSGYNGTTRAQNNHEKYRMNIRNEDIDQEVQKPIVIPIEQLSPEIVERVVASFVLEEGTDYGDVEYTLPDKVQQIMAQIHSGDLLIGFDPITQTPRVITKLEWQAYIAAENSAV